MLRALGFAVIAHLLLMMALGWGVNWKRDPVTLSVEAELWSALPQEAAPRLVEPLPVLPAPVPVPPPVVTVEPPKPEPEPREAEIAIEREKAKERKAEQDAAARRKAAEERKLEAKRDLDARRQQDLAKARAAEDKQKLETARREKAEKAIEAQRQANLERMKGMAGATGPATATGAALRASGPSTSYAGRIAARIRANIVFADTVPGNPVAEVQIRVAPDGTIVGKTLLHSSGVKAWDEAVLRAIDRTGVLPRDTDGRVVPQFPIAFRPND